MKRVLLAILFIIVCSFALLTGIYTYFGSIGTLGGREVAIARAKFFVDPSFSYKRQYLTKSDLEGLPENIAEEYKDSVMIGYNLAVQGDLEKIILFLQSTFLFAAGVAGLVALKRPQRDD